MLPMLPMLRALLFLCWAAGATPSPAYTLTAGVQIPAPVVSRLQALAEKYQAETGQTLVITDGTRSPATQAGLMLRNLERGDDIVRNYANKTAAAEVLAAWEQAKAQELAGEAMLTRITEVIAAQVADKDYVSKHLREGAVDVRCSDMSKAQRVAFKRVARQLGIAVVDESRTATPHFHLNFV